MSHDETKTLMGSTESSARTVTNHKGSIAAGLGVRLKSDDTLSVASSGSGALLGISLGVDLSGIGRTAICNKGIDVPVKLGDAFTPTVGAQVNISDTTGEAVAAGGGATAVNAFYKKVKLLGGLSEDGVTLINVALIDFPGGL